MDTKPFFYLSLSAALLTAGCQTTQEKLESAEAAIPSGYERVLGDELQSHVADSTIKGKSVRSPGWSYVVYRASDGKLVGTSTNGSKTSEDEGTWWVEGDRVCSKWSTWVKSETVCAQFYTGASDVYYITSDAKAGRFAYSRGNTTQS